MVVQVEKVMVWDLPRGRPQYVDELLSLEFLLVSFSVYIMEKLYRVPDIEQPMDIFNIGNVHLLNYRKSVRIFMK